MLFESQRKDIRVTINGDTVDELASTVGATIEQSSHSDHLEPATDANDLVADPLRARGGA